jgi:hypothetical protein
MATLDPGRAFAATQFALTTDWTDCEFHDFILALPRPTAADFAHVTSGIGGPR